MTYGFMAGKVGRLMARSRSEAALMQRIEESLIADPTGRTSVEVKAFGSPVLFVDSRV